MLLRSVSALLSRVLVDHDVLHRGEIILDGVMSCFGDSMRFEERLVAVYRDVNIDVDLVAELARVQLVDANDALLFFDAGADLVVDDFLARRVSDLVDGAGDNVVGYFQNDDADDDRGYGIADGHAQHRSSNTKQSADR